MDDPLVSFIHECNLAHAPAEVREQVQKVILDNCAAMIAGSRVECSRIMRGFVADFLQGVAATIVGHSSKANVAGAALANACAANALDIDDGFRLAKGHPGAVIIPAALAQAEALASTGAEFLNAVLAGYEMAMRASVAWHRHPHRGPSYHGSGSWGSLGAAAACARLLKLSPQQTRMALGIAEYHAPLAPIMTCVEHPAMVKDGIHWGAFVGVTAAHLAARGFTGIPSIFAMPEQQDLVQTLGKEWWIDRLYFKFFPCCRWAQPPVAAALELLKRHDLDPHQISSVCVETFDAATKLSTRRPRTTEEAQYSLPYTVACALARQRLGVAEVTEPGLNDPLALELAERVVLKVADEFEQQFPARALARLRIAMRDGRPYASDIMQAPGDAESGVTFQQLGEKAAALISADHATELSRLVKDCHRLTTVDPLCGCLAIIAPISHERSPNHPVSV
ncbi:MAG TPA: MmgE/PrpD family protein [Planctomycetota bacterium]|nr:MmgE/PrpD family protein [Planctomycetota bacterium]